MKRTSLLTLVTLSASLVTAGYVLGQNKAAAPASAPAPKQQKLVHIATLKGAEANREFQANVQLLQAQRQAVLELDAALNKENNAKKKKELKTQLDALMAKLNDNNAKMHKAYGFSLARNYTMEIETSHIYLLVTDEEAAKIEAESRKSAANAKK